MNKSLRYDYSCSLCNIIENSFPVCYSFQYICDKIHSQLDSFDHYIMLNVLEREKLIELVELKEKAKEKMPHFGLT